MKIYILTCINEDSELVFCKAYKTRCLANADMLMYLENEREEFIGSPGHYCNIGDLGAAIGDETRCYVYYITEDEL